MAGVSSRTRRTGWVDIVLLVAAAATGVLSWRYHLANAATLVGLVGGVFGLTGTWLTWSGYRDDRRSEEQDSSLASIADELAIAVREQWQAEAARRQLNDPSPLPVRWQPTDATATPKCSAL